jgi:hypothetical protein
MFFAPAQVINDTEKKKHACCYINIITADLWELIPEYGVTISFNEFKSTIFKLYPSSESKCKWTIANMSESSSGWVFSMSQTVRGTPLDLSLFLFLILFLTLFLTLFYSLFIILLFLVHLLVALVVTVTIMVTVM